jgi:hypothetical protein
MVNPNSGNPNVALGSLLALPEYSTKNILENSIERKYCISEQREDMNNYHRFILIKFVNGEISLLQKENDLGICTSIKESEFKLMPLQLGTSMLLTKIEHFPMFLIWKDPALSILITACVSEHSMD